MIQPIRLATAGLAALLLSACSDSDAPSSEDPVDYIESSPVGYQAAPAVAIGEKAVLAWFKALVSGSTMPDGEVPAKMGWLDTAKKCSFPRPAATDMLVQVQTAGSGLSTGVVALSEAQLRALSTPEAIAELDADPAAARSRAAMKLVDVVVTDTRGPVYLVLAGGTDILWNIQKAPDVKISQVALIAGDNTGIANLDPSVPVTVLAGKMAVSCGVVPARLPKDGWTSVAEAAEGDMAAIDAVKRHTEKYESYNAWFRTTFGQDSDPVTIGVARMSHALVGPAAASLEQRLPYRGIADATVRLAPTHAVFYSASPDDFGAKIKQLANAPS